RQHYLRFRLPDTYRHLQAAGLRADHSMGFGRRTGFRAGVAHPFYFYDLLTETPTSLRVWPFAAMDTALLHAGHTPASAVREVGTLADRVRAVGGHFCTLFHNESPGGLAPWHGWRTAYPQILERAACGSE
ncbi:MAG: hypothetical protein WBA12_04045, partial [Catalinimonas sp.]